MRRHSVWITSVSTVIAGTIAVSTSRGRDGSQADFLRRAIAEGRARNVILFLGDGMGDSEITIARNYQVGAAGRLWMTLIIVTADHAHTSQIVPVPSITDTTRPGTLSTLRTKGDRSLMTVNYGTRAHGQSQDHTGSQVRIAASGPQAANVVGISDQTDLFHTIARALGLEQ